MYKDDYFQEWIDEDEHNKEVEQHEKAAEMIDKGKRVKLVKHWWGWTVTEVKEFGVTS